jgi:PilZ domain
VCLRTMHPKRRSGRIAKELDIVLLGTDTTGKVFSEATKTVVLSRHGAGIVSRYRFTPDEVLRLRLPDSSKEAEVRLVGQIGGEPGRYIHGVAFVDPDLHFWPMEFPPPESPESFESGSHPLALECSLCQERQNVEPHEIEEDVYSVNGNILRYCESCGTATPWKKAAGEQLPAPGAAASKAPMKAPRPSPAPPECIELPLRVASPVAVFRQPLTASYLAASGAPASRYSGASALEEFSSFGEEQASPDAARATAVLQPPEVAAPAASAREEADISPVKPEVVLPLLLDANGKRINRRRHMRIRVNFSACVRQAAHTDEIVECENISKGGVCFHSLQKYAMDSLIEIAAPYSPGETALFAHAKVKRIEALSGGLVFRYGLEYMKSPSPSA